VANHTFELPLISQNEIGDFFIEYFMSLTPNDIRFQKYADYLINNIYQ